MQSLTHILDDSAEYQDVLRIIKAGRSPITVSGLSTVHRSLVASALSVKLNRNLVFICHDEQECKYIKNDLQAFLDNVQVLTLPTREFVFHHATVSRQWEQQRLNIFYKLLTNSQNLAIVTTPEALLLRTIPPEILSNASFTLKVGDEIKIETLVQKLVRDGYSRSEQVEGVGQFSVRGGIVDIYSPSCDSPVRIEFWGDEIDTMSFFDILSQRRTDPIEKLCIIPTCEVLPTLASQGKLGLIADIERFSISVDKKIKNNKAKLKNMSSDDLLRTLESDSRQLADLGEFYASDRYIDLIYKNFACGADYIPSNSIVCWGESGRCLENAKNSLWRITEDCNALINAGIVRKTNLNLCADLSEISHILCKKVPNVYLNNFMTAVHPSDPKALINFSCKQLPSFGNDIDTAISDIKHYQSRNYTVVVLCQTQGKAKYMLDTLRDNSINATLDIDLQQIQQHSIIIAVGCITSGFEYSGFALIAEGGATVKTSKRQLSERKTKSNRQKIQSFNDLSQGDIVVHDRYGIARFQEMTTEYIDGKYKDYIRLVYAGGDSLYVPATQLDMVSKYIGNIKDDDLNAVKLSSLGRTDWKKAKQKAKLATQDLAKELIKLYAERQRRPGYAFHADDPWQREFEDKFEYVETNDQLRCIQEIKADMEKPTPMDRLLCGDVGYGKTEVALRAAMKCVLEGKQVAILVPTTVLASQHYQTALKRFDGYPVKIALISRYQTGKNASQIFKEVKNGYIDILIGTHKLLSKKIEFKDLGLLIVDEEQRFGVMQKEKIKERFKQVDVLTLSATPIPRTLNMALSGIRDMSTLEDPPQDRQPVQTYVIEHNWAVITEAIRREIGRGGQVYYLHNRVEDIEQRSVMLREMLNDENISIAIAHGQMSQEEINSTMTQMVNGEIDVLVCTTIIETGIDIPNVNTLIIEDAERLGLAQLHQIRGRVGRSNRRAFAYMTYSQDKILSETASKRLSAIREFAEFGAGYKIAMRDLEIRGAGNLLGSKQSGNIIGVGYDLYLKLLEESVLEEQGITPKHVEEVLADLDISASIPTEYIYSPEQRMDIYRKIAFVRNEQDKSDMLDELIDRYGDVPTSVNNLIRIALLRSKASDCGFTEITQKNNLVNFYADTLDLKRVMQVMSLSEFKNRISLVNSKRSAVVLKLRPKEDVLMWVEYLLDAYLR